MSTPPIYSELTAALPQTTVRTTVEVECSLLLFGEPEPKPPESGAALLQVLAALERLQCSVDAMAVRLGGVDATVSALLTQMKGELRKL